MNPIKPITVTFRHLQPSRELVELVELEAQRLLEQRRITTLRVTVDLPHRHRRKGTLYRVRLELLVPGRPVVVKARHPDLWTAVYKVFHAAQGALESYLGRKRVVRRRRWLPRTAEAGA
jgi:hypothetical protein